MPRFTKAEGRSLIINIGSAGYNLAAYASVYGGSKGCNQAMSSCLNVEIFAEGLDKKIEFLAISVSEVTEAAQNQSPVSLFVPAASTLAKATLQRVGCGKPLVVRYLWHAVQLAIPSVMPQGVVMGYVGPKMREMREDEKRKQ